MELLKRRAAVECVAVQPPEGSQSLQQMMQQGADDVELKVGGEVGGEA